MKRRNRRAWSSLGQLFVVGFDGTTVDRDLREFLRRYRPGGVILFRRNLEDPEQILRLTTDLQETTAPVPLLICIDQEGGRVWRLPPPFTRFPEARALGEAGSEVLAYATGRVMAQELCSVGIDCNLAPVLDLHTNPANPVIGDRAIGSDPRLVATLARSILLGFRAHGIAGCGKHFPGHGDTDLDSHKTLPTVPSTREQLLSAEIAPYRALCQDPSRPLELVMTAHVRYPSLDPRRPATLSRSILTGMLRRHLGFEGPIITDDLEMGAITGTYGASEACLLALRAGADLLLFCHTPGHLVPCLESLTRHAERGFIPLRRLKGSLRRIERLKKRLALRRPPEPVRKELFTRIGCPEHQALVHQLESFCPGQPQQGSSA